MKRYLPVALFWLLLPDLTPAAEQITEIIPLEHRPLNEVIPVLKPLVEPGGTLTGMNDQLVIKASPANVEALRAVLAELDRAPRQLLISVKQDAAASARLREQSLGGRYDGGMGVESRTSQRGDVALGAGDRGDNRLEYSLSDRERRSDERSTYQIRATEGYPALIRSGLSVPLPQRSATVTPGGTVIQEGREYRDVTSGFYVLPRVRGERIRLEVAPRIQRLEQGHGLPIVRLQDVQTVVEGRLGEWLSLGGIDQTGGRAERRILDRRAASRSEHGRILIKVEELR